MEHDTHHMVEALSSKQEYLKFLAVITGIVLASLVIAFAIGAGGLAGWTRIFMGVFFMVFAGFKFIGYKMFALMFAGYDVIAKRFRAYSYAYPFIELALGLFYLLNFLPLIRDFVTLGIMSIGTVGVWQEIRHRRSGVYCACLGNVIRLPLSTVSLIEDVGMGLMALAMIIWQV